MKKTPLLLAGALLLSAVSAWAAPETVFTPNRYKNTEIVADSSNQYNAVAVPAPAYGGYTAGTMVAYRDNYGNANGNVKIKRVKNDGTVYTPSYMVNSDNSASLDSILMVPSGTQFIVCFLRGNTIYMTRRDEAGGAYTLGGWSAYTTGKPIAATSYAKTDLSMVSDGAGGAFICWSEFHSPYYIVFVQRVDANGNVLYSTLGRQVVDNPTYSMYAPKIIPSNTNTAIVAWNDAHGAYGYDIYAQRISGSNDAGFTKMWNSGTPVIVTANMIGNQQEFNMCPDDSGGAFVAFTSNGGATGMDIYLQRVNLNGGLRISTGGIVVCAALGDQSAPVMACVTSSSASYGKVVYLAWTDNRNSVSTGKDIYAGKITSSSSIPYLNSATGNWGGVTGMQVCNAAGDQFSPRIVLDSSVLSTEPGVLIAWGDPRNGAGDNNIFAARYANTGSVIWGGGNGAPISEAPGNQPNDTSANAFRVWSDPNNTKDFMFMWLGNRVGKDIQMQKENQAGNYIDRIGPSAPYLTTEPNTNSVTPLLEWSPVSGATKYYFNLSTSPLFSSFLIADSIASCSYQLAYGTVGRGTYYWRVKARDDGDNYSSYSTTSSFRVDTIAPRWSGFSVANGDTISSDQPELRAILSDTGAIGFDSSTIEMWVDGQRVTHSQWWPNYPNYVMYTPGQKLADTAWHRAVWFAKDSVQNGGWADSGIVNFYVDLSLNDVTGPTFSTPTPAQGTAYDHTTGYLTVGVADPSGIDTHADNFFVINSTDTIRTVTFDTLTGVLTTNTKVGFNEGANRIDVVAFDRSANANRNTFSWNFNVDITAPSAPSLYNLPATMTTPYLAVDGTGEYKALVLLYVNGTLVGNQSLNAGTSYMFSNVTLTEGQNIIQVNQIDSAGNTGPFGQDTVMLDATPPAPPVLLTAQLPAATSSGNLLVRGTAERNSYIRVFVNNTQAGWQNMGAQDTFGIVVNLAPGMNSLTASQTDSAGNMGPECAAVTVVMDVTSPVTDSTRPRMRDTIISQKPLLWAAMRDLGGAGINPDSLRFILNGNAVTGTWDGLAKFSHVVTADLADKSWNYFRVSAMDLAGNRFNGDSVAFYVDKTSNDNIPPVISGLVPAVSQTSDKPFISANAQDYENGIADTSIHLFIDGISKIHSWNAALSQVTYQPTIALSQGWHRCSLSVRDASPNHNEARAVWSFFIDSYAPGVPILSAPVSQTTQSTTLLYGNGTESGAQIQLYCNGVPAASGTADAGGAFTLGPVALNYGNNSFQATAADSLGNSSAYSSAVSVMMDNVKPVFVSVSPAEGDTVGSQTPVFTFQVSDGAGSGIRTDSLFLFIGGTRISQSRISYANGTFTYQEPAQPFNNLQKVTYTVSVRDMFLNSSDTVTAAFTVDTAKSDLLPPVFSNAYPAPNTAVNTNLPEIRLNATDPSGVDGANVIFELDGVGVGCDFTGTEMKYRVMTALAEGSHSMRVIANDMSAAKNTDSLKWDFFIDTYKPSRPQIYQASTPTNSQQITLTGKSEPRATVVLLRVSDTLGSVIADSLGDFMKPVILVEGQNRITAFAIDTAGNTGVVSSAMIVDLDTRAPLISNAYPAMNGVVSTGLPVISAQLSDSGGVVDSLRSYMVVVDKLNMNDTLVGDSLSRHGAAYNPLTGILSWQPATAAPLKDNWSYQVLVFAYDKAGNQQNLTITFQTRFTAGDGEPPQISSYGPTGTVSNKTPQISAIVTDNTRLNLAGTTLKIDLTPVTFSYDSVLKKLVYQASAPMSEGVEHTVELTAKDTAGNSKTQQWSFTIDATAPAAPVMDALPEYVKTLSATVTGHAEGLATVQAVILGAVSGTGNADATDGFSLNAALAEGENVVRAQAVDAAGNASALSQPDTVFADIRAPYLVSSSPMQNASVSTSPLITAQIADTGKSSGINPSSVILTVDGKVVRSQYAGGAVRLDTTLVLTSGSHSYNVQTADMAGNTFLSQSVTFIADPAYVDNVPPVFSGFTPANNSRVGNARPAISVNISDASSAINAFSVKLSLDLSIMSGAVFTASTGLLAYTPASNLAEGLRFVEVIAADAAGNRDTVEWKFVVDLTPPARPAFTSKGDTLVTSPFVTLQAVSSAGADLSLYRDSILVSSIPGLTSDTFLITDIPVTKGANRFYLVARDEVGNASAPSETLNVVLNTAAPVIANAGIGSITAKEDSSFAFQIIASDGDGNRLYYSFLVPATPSTYGMAIDSNGQFTWNPTLPASSMGVQIRVDDGFGLADSMLFLATATPVNDKPVVAGLRDTVVTRVDSVRIPFTITDEENDAITAGVRLPLPDPSMSVVHGSGSAYTLVFLSDSAFADTVRLYAFDGTDSTFAKVFVSVSLTVSSRTLTFPSQTDTLRLKLGVGLDTTTLEFPYDADIAGKLAAVQRISVTPGQTLGNNIPLVGDIYELTGLDTGFTCRLALPVPAGFTGNVRDLMLFRRADGVSPWRALTAVDTSLLPKQVAAWLTGFSQYVLGFDSAAPVLHIDSVNANLMVYATVYEGIPNPRVTLNYRAGGAAVQQHQAVVLTTGGAASVVDSVPASFASAATNGFEYWLTATDGLHVTATKHRARTAALASPALPAAVFSVNSFRMVSLPFDAAQASPDSVLRDVITADLKAWRIGRWRATGADQGSYVDHTPGTADNFLKLAPGVAVWAYTAGVPASATTLSTAYSTPIVMSDSQTQGFQVALLRGWNQVGNPYPFPVKAADVQFDPALVQQGFHGWNPSTQLYSLADTLKPYNGYFVFANTATTLLFPSLPPSAAKTHVAKADSTAWTAILSSGSAQIRFGEASDATLGHDNGLDRIGPPSIVAGLSFAIAHKEWNAWASRNYVQDIRSVAAQGNIWSVRAARPAGSGTASYPLSFGVAGSLAAGDVVAICFPAQGIRADLSKGESAELAMLENETTADFILAAGTREYVDLATAGTEPAPKHTDLAQNAPNPFNPTTIIRYQVQKPGHLTLSVYDLRGRLISRLVDKAHKPGYFSVMWNGRTAGGVSLASGVYLYRIETGRFAKTCRMVMVK